jgi:hypothetical protein
MALPLDVSHGDEAKVSVRVRAFAPVRNDRFHVQPTNG